MGHRAGYNDNYVGYAPPIGEWTLADQTGSPSVFLPVSVKWMDTGLVSTCMGDCRESQVL